jgi:hypothetical protein
MVDSEVEVMFMCVAGYFVCMGASWSEESWEFWLVGYRDKTEMNLR